jgi:hypothetical protein
MGILHGGVAVKGEGWSLRLPLILLQVEVSDVFLLRLLPLIQKESMEMWRREKPGDMG